LVPPPVRDIATSDVYLEGQAGLHAYRDAIAETSEISPLCDAAGFRVRSLVHHLGCAVLTDVQSSSVQYVRSARHVARAAYDHYQITVNLTGDILCESGRQSVIQRAGDILILDSARTASSRLQAPDGGVTRTPAIFIPRAVMAPLLSGPADEHFKVIRREDPQARLLADHVSHMLRTIAADPEPRIHSGLPILTGMLAGMMGREEISAVAGAALRQGALDSLKRLIEHHLQSPTLCTDLICARSGWSRATVYRLFEAEGGLARYIRQRQLHRAFRELMRGLPRGRRILDLAVDCQFASEATFSRAFHRMFGVPPGEVRALAAPSRTAAASRPPRNAPGLADDDAIRWIKLLTASS
jgi:AraC-like DNA-binding protein